jgi:hypothetical protein
MVASAVKFFPKERRLVVERLEKVHLLRPAKVDQDLLGLGLPLDVCGWGS